MAGAKKDSSSVFVRKKNLQGMLEKANQEMYKRNFELAETNKLLSLVRQIDELALQSHDTLNVFSERLAQCIRIVNDYPFVGLFLADESTPRSSQLYLSGYAPQTGLTATQKVLLSAVRLSHRDHWFTTSDKVAHINLRDLSPQQVAEQLDVPVDKAHPLLAIGGMQSMFLIKVLVRSRLVGLLVIGVAQEGGKVPRNELQLFEHLSDAVGVAVDNELLFEENRKVLKELQKTNAKLRALDEAKDEFISMASHQLRTPLTAVKGYLSMVLDGDTGKLNKEQESMLNQAFSSAQRMVYLIADLLNVSRLQTGKFVIESVPANLATVVEEELSQLKEAAVSHEVTINYHKPADFPTLMLDDNKIRQVIMNFADNAIYYTPKGGRINVELKELDKSVEFTVTDTGIGVPKAEQAHLFNKFYRAGNARKARPDGTGLGLFMAKKVIMAQGGSIIFKSQEGKGSTFGFTFAKDKLAPPKTP